MGRLPNFLIAGAMKSGTTSLQRWLNEHPQVFMSEVKELFFFERDDLWERGPEWYANQFAGADGAVAVGEATPNYMFLPAAIDRIASVLSGARFVITLRDPVERAYSHYLHWVEREVRERRSFATAIEDELRLGDFTPSRDRLDDDPPWFGYIARGHYADQLERIEDRFGRDRMHVVLLDDIKTDAAATFSGICRFLGVDDAVVPENVGRLENPYQTFHPAWLWRFMIRYRVFKMMPNRIAKHLALKTLAPRGPGEVPPMDAAARVKLAEHFAPHNARLADWLGRDEPRRWGTGS